MEESVVNVEDLFGEEKLPEGGNKFIHKNQLDLT